MTARPMKCLLLTNDYPPQTGGIQIYLWELWRRLPASEVSVFTHDTAGSAAFDAAEPYRITRAPGKVLLPTRQLRDRVNAQLEADSIDLVLIDPALPLGLLGPKLARPYGIVLHGAEATIPSQLPGLRQVMQRVLRQAELVISASQWASDIVWQRHTDTPLHYLPPGVDTERFRPASPLERSAARQHFGLADDALALLSVSRLVPRKGMDDLIAVAERVHQSQPGLELVIAGAGRDLNRLRRLASRAKAPVRFLGRVPDAELPRLYQAADMFAMLCRQRWGGLEQEGFGVVFLEAAAAGLPQIAGLSGGAAEAVQHGDTGLVVDTPGFARHRLPGKQLPAAGCEAAELALLQLVQDPALRQQMGAAARQRAAAEFSYDRLAGQLAGILKLA